MHFVFQEDNSSTAMEIVEAKDLKQMTDVLEVESLCRAIVEDPRHAKQVRYLSGAQHPLQSVPPFCFQRGYV